MLPVCFSFDKSLCADYYATVLTIIFGELMQRMFCLFLCIVCVFPAYAKDYPANWDNVIILTDQKENRCAVTQNGKPLYSFSAEPNRKLVNALILAPGKDHVMLDTREAFKQGALKINMNTPSVDLAGVPGKSYAIDLDVEGKGNVQIYFEGSSDSKSHYYVDMPAKFGNRRRTATFESDMPADLNNLHVRIDFMSGGVFKIYGVKFHTVLPTPEVPVIKPQLIFYAPFDGSVDAVRAAGDTKPLKAENIEFAPGRSGQAAKFTREAKSMLQYNLQKNIDPVRGAISFWYKPLWNPNQDTKEIWRTLLSFPRPKGNDRIGSGMFSLWIWGQLFRVDRSDDLDTYKTVNNLYRNDGWRHYAVTWDEVSTRVYIDGKPLGGISDGRSPLKDAMSKTSMEFANFIPFASFFVGCQNTAEQADGLIDELMIFSAPLDDQHVNSFARAFQPFSYSLAHSYFQDDKPFSLTADIVRRDKTCPLSWKILGPDNATIKESTKPDEREIISIEVPALKPGVYVARFTAPGNAAFMDRSFRVMGHANPEISSAAKLNLKLVDTVVFDKIPGSDRFDSVGDSVIRELNGVKYLETALGKGSRFIVRFHLPDNDPHYCFELDIPDDKLRTADVIAQSSKLNGSEYELQVGYCAGDEYANQNRIITQRYLFWASNQDISLVFMTARQNAPAGVAQIRLYKVLGGLPEAKTRLPKPVDGWNREVGVYFEDPAVEYDFAVTNSTLPVMDTLINRTAAYMKYSGQSLLVYPGIWYQGIIGERYNPRDHAEDFIDAWLAKFDAEGLGYMATINQNNLEVPDGMITRHKLADGSLHSTCVSIWDTGKPNPGGWHDTPPNFNILHPDAQKATLAALDEILRTGAVHPSFKGVTLHLTRHCMHWLGDIKAGYNDYMIDGFTKDTGIKVPVDRADPFRGKLYAEWLMANAKDQWIAWRCRQVTQWFKTLAARIAAVRPDLRLCINSFVPASPVDPVFVSDPDYVDNRNREAGLDATLLADVPNIIICQSVVPADYRWRSEHLDKPDVNARMRVIDTLPLYYNALNKADKPWLNMHDRYWESAIGEANKSIKENRFSVPWIKENPWRVTTLNPISYHAMRHYVLPLRYNDLLGITKGGFLIGTYGMEEYLTPLSRAFRALPAKRFTDVAGSTGTVKIRSLEHDGKTWFYVVNTAETPAIFRVALGNAGVTDLLTGAKPAELEVNTLTLKLQPYQLRSFSAATKTRITVIP